MSAVAVTAGLRVRDRGDGVDGRLQFVVDYAGKVQMRNTPLDIDPKPRSATSTGRGRS